MSIQHISHGWRGKSAHRAPADVACLRAWWSLALYPLTSARARGEMGRRSCRMGTSLRSQLRRYALMLGA